MKAHIVAILILAAAAGVAAISALFPLAVLGGLLAAALFGMLCLAYSAALTIARDLLK